LTGDELAAVRHALLAIQAQVRWKPGKDIQHLEKRQRMGHLPSHYSLDDYNNLIRVIVRNGQNLVYWYEFAGERYYAVRGTSGGKEWLVIFSRKGIMETAFVPEEMDQYLARRGFVLVGRIEEVLR